MYNDEEKKKTKKEPRKRVSFFRKRTKRLLTNLDKLFDKILSMECIITFIFIVISILLAIFKDTNNVVISIVLCIVFLLYGALNIYGYIKRKDLPFYNFWLLYGICGIILGIVALFQIKANVILGLWLLIEVAKKADFTIRLKILNQKSMSIHAVSAGLIMIMSIMLFVNPFTNLSASQTIGIFSILYGIINVMDVVLSKQEAPSYLENL